MAARQAPRAPGVRARASPAPRRVAVREDGPASPGPAPSQATPAAPAPPPGAAPRLQEPAWLVRAVLVLFLVGFAAFLAREVRAFLDALGS